MLNNNRKTTLTLKKYCPIVNCTTVDKNNCVVRYTVRKYFDIIITLLFSRIEVNISETFHTLVE